MSASSHTGADDQPGKIGEYVKRGNKAWTAAEFNPVAVQLELCGFASWSRNEWLNNHPNMLENCAAWIAEEAAAFGIPITKLTSSQAQGPGRGVCQHVDLGSRGGGHHDCGSGFPIDDVLDIARGGAGAAGPTTMEADLIASETADNGNLHVFWVWEDGKTVGFRYQRKGETDWNDGGVLTKAPKKIVGLSSTRSDAGNLELFARYDDGTPVHTWQRAGETGWSGGQPGVQKAGFTNLPK